jgi:hypothetical protein
MGHNKSCNCNLKHFLYEIQWTMQCDVYGVIKFRKVKFVSATNVHKDRKSIWHHKCHMQKISVPEIGGLADTFPLLFA